MKKLLYTFLAASIIFASCSKEEDNTTTSSTPINTSGCTDPTACNYNPAATIDDGSCLTDYGCTDPLATNYDASATCDDGSCTYQLTYVPDDGFEQRLIDSGYDDVLDNYVKTSNISLVTSLYFYPGTVSDVTGIEDFTALRQFHASDNPITDVDISQNTNLNNLNLYNNPLYSLDLRNGKSNYSGNMLITVGSNHHLTCVSVDDVGWANQNLLANGGNTYYFIPEPIFSLSCP